MFKSLLFFFFRTDNPLQELENGLELCWRGGVGGGSREGGKGTKVQFLEARLITSKIQKLQTNATVNF